MANFNSTYVNPPVPASPSAECALAGILNSLRELSEAIGLNADRTQRIVNRAFGGPGEVNKSMPPKPVPSGTVGELQDLIADIRGNVGAQSQALNRLDELV